MMAITRVFLLISLCPFLFSFSFISEKGKGVKNPFINSGNSSSSSLSLSPSPLLCRLQAGKHDHVMEWQAGCATYSVFYN
jgi:hypothetical protein